MCGFPASGSRRRLTQSPSPLHVTLSATSENKSGVLRLIANLPFRRRFLRPPSTEAPSLHRSYPASSVLRASPPSQSARPVSRELPVDPYCDHRWDFPCCVWSPLPACRRQYPGRSGGILFARTIPSASAFPRNRGGSAPALSVSGPAQRLLTLRPARSPSRLCDPLHQRLQQSRCLHCCSDCYRVERTSSRASLPPLCTSAFSRRTRQPDYLKFQPWPGPTSTSASTR